MTRVVCMSQMSRADRAEPSSRRPSVRRVRLQRARAAPKLQADPLVFLSRGSPPGWHWSVRPAACDDVSRAARRSRTGRRRADRSRWFAL